VLVSLRAADIDRLANLAAASVGYCPNGTPSPPAAVVLDNIELLDRKILSANCVSEQLDVMVKALKAIKTKAERQQQRIKGEHAEEEEDGKIVRKEKALVGSSDLDADEERLESSEEESEIEPDEHALQAIEKLLAVKQNGFRGQGSDGDSGGEEEERNSEVSSEDDSGLIENLSEQEEDMLMDTDFISNTDEEDEGDYKKSGPGSKSNTKVKAKAKPKKPKNRLGQRARKQLAGQQQQLYGGRKPAPYRKGQGDAGKDKLFRDDGSGASRGFRETKEYTSRKRPAEKEAQDEGPLHPSWAARRQEKQKLSIVSVGVPLSNKKVVFDDDGSKKVIAPKPSSNYSKPPLSAHVVSNNYYPKRGSQSEGEGPLHPSWELKKELANAQKHIQPPQGKKIVFND